MPFRNASITCCRSFSVLCVIGALLAHPSSLAWGADVEFRIIPRLTPSGTNVATAGLLESVSSVPSGSAWTAEIWGSDLQDATYGASGLIAAYLDIMYSPAAFPSVSTHHSQLFPVFLGTEPVSHTDIGQVLNLGGVTPRLDLPQGVGPEWVRIGWIEFAQIDVAIPMNVHLSGRVGAGGIGCYGRVGGDVEVVGSDVIITPDPPVGVILALAFIRRTCVRRRYSESAKINLSRRSGLNWFRSRS